jgi:phospholipase C
MTIPDPDPGELFTDMNTQIFGQVNPPPGASPTMRGFVQSYAAEAVRNPHVSYDLKAVMHYFTPSRCRCSVAWRAVRGLRSAARFGTMPTWPNRFFVHTATAADLENNEPMRLFK